MLQDFACTVACQAAPAPRPFRDLNRQLLDAQMDAETLVTVMRNIRDRERQVERLLAQKFARQRDLQDQAGPVPT